MSTDSDFAFAPSLARVVGAPAAGVDLWGITKKEGKRFVRLQHPDAEGTHLRMWPLPELTIETIRERWGAGEFRIQWFHSQPDFGSDGTGPLFVLDAPEPAARVPAPVAAPAPVASSLPQGLTQALEVMALFDQRAGSMLERTMNVAAAMANRSNGLDASTLGLLLGQQAQQTQSLLTTMQQQHEQSLTDLRAEIASLRTELDGGDDDEDDDDGRPSAIAGVAAAAAQPFIKKGQDLKSALLNYAAQHPEDVFGVLKAAPDVVRELAKLAAASQAQVQPPQQPAPPPASRSRPVASPVVRPPVLEAAPEPGLNAILAQQPKVEPAAVAPEAAAE